MREVTSSSDRASDEGSRPDQPDLAPPEGEGPATTDQWQPILTIEPAARSWRAWGLLAGGVALLVVVGAIAATRLPSGTTLAGTPVASVEGAPSALDRAAAQLADLQLRVTTATGTETTLTAADLGLQVDRDLSTDPVRTGLPSMGAWLRRIPDGPVAVPFLVQSPPPAALTDVAEQVSRDPVDADVGVQPAGVEVTDGADGIDVGPGQVDAGLAAALATIATLDPAEWPAVLEVPVEGSVTAPAVTQTDIDAVIDVVDGLDDAEVVVTAMTPAVPDEAEEDGDEAEGTRRELTEMALTPRELRALVDVESVDGAPAGQRLTVVPAPEQIPPRLVALMDLARVAPTLTATVENRSETPDRDDDLTDVSAITGDVVVQDREAGFEPDREATLAAVIDAALAGGGSVEVVGDEEYEADAADLGILQPVSTFTTFYTPGQSRNVNIRRIAEIVDGTIIPAGESYELNHAVGRRTRERGFTDGGAILDGELVSDVGGGVSQFATTFFNAAWFAGVELVDWKPHSFYFSRYPAGREATINFPNVNLEIRNDTPHAILVDTEADESSVTVTFWSTPYWEVETISGPCGCGGSFRITVDRVRTAPGAAPIEESWTTLYLQQPSS